MLLNCGIGEDYWEYLELQGDPTSPSWRKSVLNFHWKDWCWSLNSNTLAMWCKELTHLKRPWCWERLKAGGEGDDRGWDGWMASLTHRTWVWVNSGSWWWTGRPGMPGPCPWCSRVRHDWGTELNWTNTRSIGCMELKNKLYIIISYASFFTDRSHILFDMHAGLQREYFLTTSDKNKICYYVP